jgi:hypothetical protein
LSTTEILLLELSEKEVHIPTTSLACADQIFPRRIAAFRAPATNGSGVLRTPKPLR